MKNKIVVVGSSNVDLLMKMDHLPEMGETVTDAEFFQVYGGKGANQAVAAARSGGKVALVNCVGEDAYTPQMVRNYKEDGIDTTWVFHEKGIASGHALIMIGDAGNNYLAVAPGANYLLTPDKIRAARQVFEDAGMVVMQYEITQETIQAVIDLANEMDIPVLWNFAPAREFDRTYLSRVKLLVLNEVEAGFLAGMVVEDDNQAEQAATKLVARGVEWVIITLGEKGTLAMSEGERIFIPAYNVNAIDTTAAGDTFCGALAVALLEAKAMEEAVKFANAAAAISVTRMGAQPSAPEREEIDAFMLANRPNRDRSG
jgi:ribokinase